MLLDSLSLPPDVWARHHFGALALGDVRLTRRALALAEAMARQPGASLPQLCGSWKATKAAYRFFAHEHLQPDMLQHQHRSQVADELACSTTPILLIEDTSVLSWTNQAPIEGLGPIAGGQPTQQGFLLHSVLAARWQRPGTEPGTRAARLPMEILGVVHQQYHVRAPAPSVTTASGTKGKSRRAAEERDRESVLWERAGEALGPAPSEVRWIRVADRGADLFEYLEGAVTYGHGFVVRAAQNRVLVDPENHARQGKLFDPIEQAPWGSFILQLRARPGQPAREVRLQLKSRPVWLQAPQRPGRKAGSAPPLACSLLQVYETDPPEGQLPLLWWLLCDGSITSFEEAIERALQYASRWLIEDYHKAIKTGLGAERLQMKRARELFLVISLMSVVALSLVQLREQWRVDAQAEASVSGLSELEREVLSRMSGQSLGCVDDVARAVGALGGHLGRRHDGPPGWITLWRGMRRLRDVVDGVRLSGTLATCG